MGATVVVVQRRQALLDGFREYTPFDCVVSLDLNVAWHELVILNNHLMTEATFVSFRAGDALRHLLLELEETAKLVHIVLLRLRQHHLLWLSAFGNGRRHLVVVIIAAIGAGAAVAECYLGVVVDDVLFIDLAQRRLFLRIGYDTVSLLMCRSSTL